MELIPAIDLMDGKCVRLQNGDFNANTIYDLSPLDVAKSFETIGITRLHVVDLDGASGRPSGNMQVLEQLATETSLVIDFGGGIKTTTAVRSVLDAGASMLNVGSVIAKEPELFKEWVLLFGAEKFLPGADVLDMHIRVSGWQEETGIHVFDFIRNLFGLGIFKVFCTDISKDGMLKGPGIPLYNELLTEFSGLKLIASGGVSSYDDLRHLADLGCTGTIVGKAFYEQKITLEEMAYFINNH